MVIGVLYRPSSQADPLGFEQLGEARKVGLLPDRVAIGGSHPHVAELIYRHAGVAGFSVGAKFYHRGDAGLASFNRDTDRVDVVDVDRFHGVLYRPSSIAQSHQMPLSFFDGLPEGGARAIEASGMRFDFGIVATIVGLIGNFRDEGIDFDRSFDFHDVLVGAEEGGHLPDRPTLREL